jgi:ABC-type multidrug transport system ATPase subunit
VTHGEKSKIPAGWVGGFAESNKKFTESPPDLRSLDMLKNMDNIHLLERQQAILWPEFSWESERGAKDPKRCFQMFAPDISRVGYTNEGRVYSIICPQQGIESPSFGSINVEISVTGQRGWVDENTRELACDMTVEAKIWFGPGYHENAAVKLLWKLLDELGHDFPISKDKAVVVKTHKPGDPSQPIFRLAAGETTRFDVPEFARHKHEAWSVGNIDVEIGQIVTVVLLYAQLFEPVQQLSQLYNTVQSSAASLNKLFGILDTEPDVDDGAEELPRTGSMVVDGVGFRYPATETPVLSDVSITVADGERLALVGPTGAGKSTLAKLMARLYDPTEGTITFGGIDLRDATLASLRHRVVVVPQEGFLFGGTIADNVRIARADASDDEVRQAFAAIGALERFDEFSDGIHTEVRERGSRLSAGERQLVSLARAALVDPAVLVLDEATSNLDPGTEFIVEHALDSLMSGRTTIVVAHRLSTIQRADRIGVIDGGRLVELGNHDELLALGGRYAALATAWQKSQPVAGA